MKKRTVAVVIGLLVLLGGAAWVVPWIYRHAEVQTRKVQELQMEPLSEAIKAILDRIAAVFATGATPPADLVHKLEDYWRNERPEDTRGLEPLLRSLQAQSDSAELQTVKSYIEESQSTSTIRVGRWRRGIVAESFESRAGEGKVAESFESGADEGKVAESFESGAGEKEVAEFFESRAGEGKKEPGWIYPVFFGTNRAPDVQRPENGFGARRASAVTYGRCDVWVPATHRFGETGTSWWRRWSRLQFADDHLRVHKLTVFGQSEFWSEIQTEMAKATGKPHGLVYLHGYNVTFQDAAIRAAQMGFDLKVNGATGFFSWPSQGTLEGYPADAASIEASEDIIAHFLADFARQSGAEVVHLVAHSMGNRGLLRALQRLAADAQLQTGVSFGQIFLAAPDVDRDLFLDLAKLYPKFSVRTTLYASDADRALATSAWVHDGYRAGYCPPITVPGLVRFDTIRVPDFDLDLLGHSYYAAADALLYDMHELMNRNTPPEQRPRLRAIKNYWQMGR